ncbi:MAG: hypothetical protein Q4G49_03020 [Paracoccus sp. (in: a-proteobacteria)]|nr:hypothetical protein [Paracoccus sp. (in: a-proteobacteria)]
MIQISIYDIATGRIVNNITTFDPDVIDLNVGPQQAYIEGIWPANQYYIRGAVPVAFPPKPGGAFVWDWDNEGWIDPRTPGDIAADAETALQTARAAASITKNALLNACMAIGLLNPAEAAQAARGEIPDKLAPVVAGLSAEERDMIAVNWPGAGVIDRLDPYLTAVSARLGVSDAELDMIFGVIPPVEHQPQGDPL